MTEEPTGTPTINVVTGIIIALFGVLALTSVIIQGTVSDEAILEGVAAEGRRANPQISDDDIERHVQERKEEILAQVRRGLRNTILAGTLMVLLSGALAFGVIKRHKSAPRLAVIFGIFMALALITGVRKLGESVDATNVITFAMILTLLVLSGVAYHISKPTAPQAGRRRTRGPRRTGALGTPAEAGASKEETQEES